MASKSDKMNKTMCLLSLLGLFAGVLPCSCSYGFQKYLEPKNRGHFGEDIVQLGSNVARITQDGLITLAIKYVHFFVSRCLQFRYLSPLQPGPSSISMLFWVAFTRSISSMSNDTL